MLAYVFWHIKRADADRQEYESALAVFHQALAANAPAGFVGSMSFHLRQASWIPGDSGGFEDWYLLENSAALDVLNKGAVSGQLSSPHDASAKMAEWGIAGLYRSLADEPEQMTSPSALWFDKPSGVSYPSMFSRLEANEPDIGAHLWQRMMTLGPTPEFCLLGRGSDVLPYQWSSALVVRRQVT